MPHSWQIISERQQSCLIAVVSPPGGVSVDWALSWGNMQKPPIWDVMRLSGLPWDVARTQAAIQCLNGGYQFLFQLDADVCAPKDTIPRLIAHRLPIVSGLYHQRFPTWTGVTGDYLPCMFNEVVGADGKLTKQAIVDYKPGSLVEAHLVPGGCLLPDTEVITNDCWIEAAENITEDSHLLAGDGTFKKLDAIKARDYDGAVVEINTALGGLPIKLTADHLVYMIQTEGSLSKMKCRPWACPIVAQCRGKWVKAEDVKPGDILILPRAKEAKDITELRIDDLVSKETYIEDGLIYPRRGGVNLHKKVGLPSSIPLNNDFMKLAGYFLAEGSALKDRGISLAFGKHEQRLIVDTVELIKGIFRIKPYVRERPTAIEVGLKSSLIGSLFHKLFGRYAYGKKIPIWMMYLPLDKQVSLIKGLFEGDGCRYKYGHTWDAYSYATTSKVLAFQVRDLLIRLGIVPRMQYRPVRNGANRVHVTRRYIDGSREIVSKHAVYTLTCHGIMACYLSHLFGLATPTQWSSGRWWSRSYIDNNYAYIAVKSVRQRHYQGKVQDFQISGETFATSNFLVHNCLLVHRSVFERMTQAGIKRYFEWTLQVDSDPPGSGMSEDFSFCSKARSLGFKCFCDTSIVATHETGAQVGVKGLLPKL